MMTVCALTCCRLHIPWIYEQLMTLDARLLSMIYLNKFTKYVTSVRFPVLLNTRYDWPSFGLQFPVLFNMVCLTFWFFKFCVLYLQSMTLLCSLQHDAGAVICDSDLSSQLKSAAYSALKKMEGDIQDEVPTLMSGAGHDAMAISHLTKVTYLCILFVVFEM